MDRDAGAQRFDTELVVAAARLYYVQDATQAQIAERLGTSRPTVSRLLAEARRLGIVRIEIVPPEAADHGALVADLAEHLGLTAVWLAPSGPAALRASRLAQALRAALQAAGLSAGDVLLMSSGRSVYACAQDELLPLPGVLVAPTVGGQDEPEAWYQTNEITRQVASRIGGQPAFLYAPAYPSSELRERLLDDPATMRVLQMWDTAKCAVLGVGAPPRVRPSVPGPLRPDDPSLDDAVGDICARFYDATGSPLAFPGSERLLSTTLAALRRMPATIAVAAGNEKIPSLLAGARAGWFNQLVTDASTARLLLAAP